MEGLMPVWKWRVSQIWPLHKVSSSTDATKQQEIIVSSHIQIFSGESDEVPRGGKGQRQVPRFHREGQPLHLPSGFYSTI